MHGNLETICVHVLRKCNLKCPHCWSDSTPGENDVLKESEIYNFLSDLNKLGLKRVSISGGEPSIYPGLGLLVKKLLRLNLNLTITTNGTTRPFVHEKLKLANILPTKQLNIRVSLDGTEDVHDRIRGKGTYVLAKETIAATKNWLGWVGVNTVIDPREASSISVLAHELENMNVDNWAFITLVERDSWQNDHKEVVKKLQVAEKTARDFGYSGVIHCWDYVTEPNTYALIDADKRIIFPGVNRREDIVVGEMGKISALELTSEVARLQSKNPISYFAINFPEKSSFITSKDRKNSSKLRY